MNASWNKPPNTATREDVMAVALDLFGEAEDVHAWLDSPSVVFRGRTPVQVLEEPGGVESVYTVLMRIVHGIPS